jgi:hypothetical protein
VVPTPGTLATTPTAGSLRRQSTQRLECLVPPRQGSFRQRNSPIHPTPQDKPPLAFCKRRLSWPEMNVQSTSGCVLISLFYLLLFIIWRSIKKNGFLGAFPIIPASPKPTKKTINPNPSPFQLMLALLCQQQ